MAKIATKVSKPRARTRQAKPRAKTAKPRTRKLKPRNFNELSPWEKMFVLGYVKHHSVSGAWREAGAEGALATSGQNVMNKPYIRKIIEQKIQEKLDDLEVDAFWVLQRLIAEATADLKDIYDADGQILPVKQWPMVWRQGLVEQINFEYDPTTGKTYMKTLRIAKRQKTIEMIGKHRHNKAFEEETTVIIPGLQQILDQISGKNRGLPVVATRAQAIAPPPAAIIHDVQDADNAG